LVRHVREERAAGEALTPGLDAGLSPTQIELVTDADPRVPLDPKKPIAESLRRLEQLLELLPGGTAKDLKVKLSEVRRTLLEPRPPALVLIGRRGSGKSSLVNALFGKKIAEVGHVKAQTGQGKWFEYASEMGALSILDTRGLQEGSAPAEEDVADSPMKSILVALGKKAPDMVLFVVRAFDVDSAIDKDVELLEEILRASQRQHGTTPPVFAVLTHVDMLEPRDVNLRTEGDTKDRDEKVAHLKLAERTLDDKLRANGRISPHVIQTLAVSSYLSFRDDGTLRTDDRWRIDDLAREIFAKLPAEGRGIFARVAQVVSVQEELAMDLTKAVAGVCAAIAAVPIPVADVIPITSAQLSLVAGIAWIGGRTLDTKTAGEFMAAMGVNVGAAFAFRETARALVKYVFPGAGSVVSGAVAFAGTMAIGRAATAYFVRRVGLEEAKRLFKENRG
jgi:uncharacterized protein (DUF697 family)/GTPase Era involved in 16S rRNA processing